MSRSLRDSKRSSPSQRIHIRSFRHSSAANPARGGRGAQGVRCSPSREGAGQPGSPTKDGGEEQLEGNGASVATPRKAGRDSCISLRNSPSRGNTQASKRLRPSGAARLILSFPGGIIAGPLGRYLPWGTIGRTRVL